MSESASSKTPDSSVEAIESTQRNPSNEAVQKVLGGLVSQVSEKRRLPSRIKDYLQYLVESKDEKLVNIVRRYIAKSQNNATLAEAVFERANVDLNSLWESICVPHKKAKLVSANDRAEAKLKIESINLVYGEIAFMAFATALCKFADMPEGGIFYDIGSGAGRGLFCAAIAHRFDSVRGIEIGSGLVKVCQEQVAQYHAEALPVLAQEAALRGLDSSSPEFKVIEGDLRKVNWTDGNVILASSTCFDDKLMAYISKESEKMKLGSIFLTFTKDLSSDHWRVVERKRYMMSWGYATLQTHIKIKPARVEEGKAKASAEAQEKSKASAQETYQETSAGDQPHPPPAQESASSGEAPRP